MPPRTDHLPAVAFSDDVKRFGDYLESRGLDYLVVEQTGEQRVRLRFCGTLLGQAVVWDCEFLTLAAESQAAAVSATRNFIDVGEPGPRGVPVRVGLAVTAIDRPAIEKMIIMLRNYRRLRPGRHEYSAPPANTQSRNVTPQRSR